MRLLNSIKVGMAALVLAIGVWVVFAVDKDHWFAPPAVEVKVEHYARIAAVYEGDIDWRFYVTPQMLESMAPQMPGKPMLLGHEWGDPNVCVGRIVEAAVKQDKFGHYLEVIVLINNDDSVDKIRRMAYHSVSIGFIKIKSLCMIDGKEDCSHQPGHEYTISGPTGPHKVIARFILQEVMMCEVSFVNVPASAHARVLELSNHRLSCSASK